MSAVASGFINWVTGRQSDEVMEDPMTTLAIEFDEEIAEEADRAASGENTTEGVALGLVCKSPLDFGKARPFGFREDVE